MHWLILLILSAFLFVSLLRMRSYRRLLNELNSAVVSRRRLLTEDSNRSLRKMGILDLVQSYNALIDSSIEATAQESNFSEQVEAILGAVQEVVIVFDQGRIVQYANRAAEELFTAGHSMQSLRLDAMMRSVELLELLDKAFVAERTESRQIKVEQGGQSFWFEATCSRTAGIREQRDYSALLVLHDITKLKELEVIRREFVANVSHELRTPLTIIKGFAETLIDDAETIKPESRERFMAKILNNSERLHVLVEDLLTISRLESRPDQIEPLDQPLKDLFEEVAENYRSRLIEGRQLIRVELESSIEMVSYDRYRLQQVLENLIENVFRYATGFTELVMEARLDFELKQVICSVVDNGPGIPQNDLPHIFERFYRVDKGRSRESGGTGLGLSIVKHIVQLHGGHVTAESQLGEWTRMVFTLPIKQGNETKIMTD